MRKSSENQLNKGNICLRFHSLQGKFIVHNPPENYGFLANKFFKFPIGKNKNGIGFKKKVMGAWVIFSSPYSISVTIPDVLIDSSGEHIVAEGYIKLAHFIQDLMDWLEGNIKGLKINTFCPFHLDNQHIAIVNSRYAKNHFIKYNCYYKSDDGKIITDMSHGNHELEAVNPLTAGEDIHRAIEMEHKIRYKPKIGD